MGKPGIYTYKLTSRDVDFASRPTLVALTDYVVSAAGEDADMNGFGIGDLSENGWTWVLSRFCLELTRYPLQGEQLQVQTWVSDVNRLMTTRNFVIADHAGNPIGGAVSNWVMMDRSTRRAVDLSANLTYADAIVELPSPVAAPLKIAAVIPQSRMTHRVAYSDLDFNCHTNSMRYLALMMDMLPLERHERTVRRMDLNFLHESRYGDVLAVTADDRQKDALFEIAKQEGPLVCRARIEWTEPA